MNDYNTTRSRRTVSVAQAATYDAGFVRPSANAFRVTGTHSVYFFQKRGAMRNNQYEREYPHGDLLNGEARAVIEADFEEITTAKQPRSFIQLVKDGLQWIRQRLRGD